MITTTIALSSKIITVSYATAAVTVCMTLSSEHNTGSESGGGGGGGGDAVW